MGADPEKDCEHINHPLVEGGRGVQTSLLSEGMNERFPWTAQECAILQFGGMEHHLSCLPDEPVHVARFGGEDFGVLELDVMVMV